MVQQQTAASQVSSARRRHWLPTPLSIVTANIGLCFAVLLVVANTGSSDGRYAVVAMPGSSPTAAFNIVSRAGGTVLTTGGLANSVIAQSDAPDFRARLSAAGAFLILNPLLFDGCQTTFQKG